MHAEMLTQKCELLHRSGTHGAMHPGPGSDPEQAGCLADMQAAVWFCLALSTCPWVTSCKKGDGSADASKKAAFLKCEFACFAWNWCIGTVIYPLSTEYSSNSLFCSMKPRSVKMHPFEVLDVTGLGDIFLLSFPRKAFWSHQNAIGK